MDIKALATKNAYERAVFLHFTHPAYKHALFADGDADGRGSDKSKEKIGLTVKSIRCKAAQDFLKASDNLTGQDLERAFYKTYIVSVHGLEIDGRAATVDDLPAIFAETPEFLSQLSDFVYEVANFFEKPAQ